MYPLVHWKKNELTGRIDRLIKAGFDIEAVVATSQTIEQIIKRSVVHIMNKNQIGFECGNNKFRGTSKGKA